MNLQQHLLELETQFMYQDDRFKVMDDRFKVMEHKINKLLNIVMDIQKKMVIKEVQVKLHS